ncbi:hypothetical protein [Streptomyces xanthophaeus]
MALTISLVCFAGVLVVVLVRTGYLRLWPALAAVLFGFSLASTGIAPAINGAISNVAGWISTLG